MVSFESDYNNGAVPEILKRLLETNDDRTSGYGSDPYCDSAKEKIRKACGKPDAEIFFLSGGTQANATVIDALALSYEGVLTAPTGHINVHESGAVEAFGHKVIPVQGEGSKLTAEAIDSFMSAFEADGTNEHMVRPGVVYLTFPTELGAIYSRKEIDGIYEVCRHSGLKLFIDGARLGYGLMSAKCDLDLPFIAEHCDVFYIGGTKVGAMFGEAVVFTNIPAPKHMLTIIKRHGALVAKGRMLGIQFDTLFTDDLYFRIAAHAIEMAEKVVGIFRRHGIRIGVDSPTNQQFVILSKELKESLMNEVAFEVWEPMADGNILCRFVTSWATTDADLGALDSALGRLCRSV